MQPSLLHHPSLNIIDAVLHNKSIPINFADQGHEFSYFQSGNNSEENIIFIQTLSSFTITTLAAVNSHPSTKFIDDHPADFFAEFGYNGDTSIFFKSVKKKINCFGSGEISKNGIGCAINAHEECCSCKNHDIQNQDYIGHFQHA